MRKITLKYFWIFPQQTQGINRSRYSRYSNTWNGGLGPFFKAWRHVMTIHWKLFGYLHLGQIPTRYISGPTNRYVTTWAWFNVFYRWVYSYALTMWSLYMYSNIFYEYYCSCISIYAWSNNVYNSWSWFKAFGWGINLNKAPIIMLSPELPVIKLQ